MLSPERKKATGQSPDWFTTLSRLATITLLAALVIKVNDVAQILNGKALPAAAPSAKVECPVCPVAAAAAKGTFFAPPRTRDDVAWLLQERGFKVGAELGVQRGHFSAHTLRLWTSCERYYLIDAWQHQVNYEDIANVVQGEQDKLFNEAKAFLEPFKSRTIFLRNYTNEAVKHVTEPLDFVYVDARHDYCGVLEDLELYYPKIKSGGIIAGHDYLDAHQVHALSKQNWAKCMNGTINHGAVKGAVDDFFRPLGLQVHVTYQDPPWSTWVVFKP